MMVASFNALSEKIAALNTYRFPLKGSLLRRLSGLRSHYP